MSKKYPSIQKYYDELYRKGLYNGTYQTLRKYIALLREVIEENDG